MDKALESKLWVKIRIRRALLVSREFLKPKETRKEITWQDVYDNFLYNKKKLSTEDFIRIVKTKSGQTDVLVV